MRKAVIDVGSNSVLLLVAEQVEGVWRPVLESSVVTGLGEGVKATGSLSQRGIAETLEAVRLAYAAAQALGCVDITAAATMAARLALNSGAFLQAAQAQETPVRVLPAQSEAELGFLAVAEDPLFASEPILTIIDPGGNSTELVTASRQGNGWEKSFAQSFPVGTLGLRDTLLRSESPSSQDLLAASAWIDETLGLEYLPQQSGRAVVLGATGTNLITIRERMTEWNPARVHGAVLEYEEIGRAVGWLNSMSDTERSAIVGIEPGREKTIHIGTLILERFLHAIHSPGCTVSVRGWRHALLECGKTDDWF